MSAHVKLQSRTKAGTVELDHVSSIPLNQCWKMWGFFSNKKGKNHLIINIVSGGRGELRVPTFLSAGDCSYNRWQNCSHIHFFNPLFRHCESFFPLACPFQPSSLQTMLCGNCCDLELQTSNIEWGSGVFSTVYCAMKRVVLFGALKVLLKDNVSTNYVADCSRTKYQFHDCPI